MKLTDSHTIQPMLPSNHLIASASPLWLFDLAIYISAFWICLIATLLWVYKSKQAAVKPTQRLSWHIALRMAIVFGLGYAISTLIYSSAPGIILLSFAFILYLFTAVGSPAGLLGLPLFLGIQQFVLWFPARHAFVNRETTAPIQRKLAAATPDVLVGKSAITASPLRPAGEVTLDNQRYAALSENQQFIEAKCEVIVLGRRGETLLVARLE